MDAIPEGSGECIDGLINDTQKADIVSPASEAFVRLGNTEGRAKLGREVIGPTQSLVLSPVVIGIWEPMAKALVQIRYDFDRHTIRVFTIGYEAEDGTGVLKQISEVTQGRYYEGTEANIREIFREISTFF